MARGRRERCPGDAPGGLARVKPAAAPRRALPEGACDCHVHFFQPHFADPPKAGTPLARIDSYRAMQARLGLQRVVVVQPWPSWPAAWR